MPARILTFVSRATKLRWRAARDYGRFVTKRGVHSHPDIEERARLLRERHDERRADAAWAERHRPLPAGATVVRLTHAESGDEFE